MGISLAAFVVAVGAGSFSAAASDRTDVGVISKLDGARKMNVMEARASVKANGGEIYEIGAGDKLRIKFFQREELSGEFRVRADGNISLPLIGALSVHGRTPVELEHLISSKFFEMTSRSAFAVVDVIERRPFFVAGDVNQPGTFQYVPSMTVTHAIAIAGGIYRLPQAPNQLMDVAREQWRLRSASADAAVQIAKRARLRAQLAGHSEDGQSEIVFPKIISQLVGERQANQIQATQQRLFQQSVEWRRSQTRFLKESVKLAEEELDELRSRLNTITETLKVHDQDLATTEKLFKRGLTQRRNVYQKKYAISNMRTTAANVKAEIKRAELKRVRTLRELAEFGPGEDRKISGELATVEAQAESSLRNIEASRSVIGQAGVATGIQRAGFAGATPRYVILRAVEGKLTEVAAGSHDRVLPGDVLKVVLEPAADDSNRSIEASHRVPNPASGMVKAAVPAGPAEANPQTDALISHLVEMKDLIKRQSKRLQDFEEQQRELSREVKDWRTRYQKVLSQGATQASAPKTAVEPKSEAVVPAIAAEEPKAEKRIKTPATRVSTLVPLPIQRPRQKLDARGSVVSSAGGSKSRRLVVSLQSELKRIGCYVGKVDGIWGPLSRSALDAFAKRANDRELTSSASMKAYLKVKSNSRVSCAGQQVAANATGAS